MREHDNLRRDTLRYVLAAIKQSEVDGRKELNDQDVQLLLAKQAKQRQESIADGERAGREDLVAQEKAELAIIESYLPQMMSREEVDDVAREVITATGATSIRDMGAVMGKLMPQLRGKADGKTISAAVKELLQG